MKPHGGILHAPRPRWVFRTRVITIGIVLAGVVSLAAGRQADAIQGATPGILLLGSKGPGAGILPPPGLYFQNTVYNYNGVFGDQQLTQWIDILQLTLVTDATFLGGRYAAGLSIPFAFAGNATGETAAGSSDIKVMPIILGWHAGNYHTTLTVLAHLPTGAYEVTAPLNVSPHWFAVDAAIALTYLNPHNGLEATLNVGYTINWLNPATNYQSGNQLRFDAMLLQHLANGLGFGVAGYGMTQTTGDSGAGAVLGPFEGQLYAAGPAVVYDAGTWSLSARYFFQFGAVNQFQGNQLYLTGAVKL